MSVTLLTPLAWFQDYNVRLELRAFALQTSVGDSVQSTVYLGVVLALATLLPLITIFLFKNRLLQLRLCVVEMVLLVGAAVMEGVYYYLSGRAFAGLDHPEDTVLQGVHVPIALPIVCLIFAFLAARAVFHDELLVRAADRIR